MSKFFFCGIDVSKDKIDICFLGKNDNSKPKYETIPNIYNMIYTYFSTFKFDELVVVFESTSNYHIFLQQVLSTLKIKYNVLNPMKSSLFLRHLTHIKNDATDSLGLAIYSKTFSIDLFPDKFSNEYKLLKSYSSTLNLLQKINTQIKNFEKSQAYVNDEILKNTIKDLKLYVKDIHKKLRAINYELLKTFIPNCDEILSQNKGIGIDLAIVLFPILHFNKDKSIKQVISFLGLSPRVYESGSSIKKSSKINKIGSNNIRRVLYMSALSCIQFNEIFKERYDRLLLKNKPKKVAIVSVMCAIVRYLKSIYFKFELKNDKNYN